MAQTTSTRRSTGSRRSTTSRNGNAKSTTTRTQRSARAKTAAASRQRNTAARSAARTRSNARRTATSARTTARQAAGTAAQTAKAETTALESVVKTAQRGVLIPVGAALVARDNVLEAVRPYTKGRVSAEREVNRVQTRVATNLRKFERRGETARNRLQRQVKRTRTQV